MAKIILFSGHMTDGPQRPAPRFPARAEPAVSAAIGAALAGWQVGPGDIGICGAARGGDILFGEHCLARGAELRLFLPLPVPAFLAASIHLPAALDSDWEARFRHLLQGATTRWPAAEYGSDAPAAQPFIDNNARMLTHARALAQRGALHVLLLWDGRDPDGKGGTAEIARATEDVAHRLIIDPGAA